MIVGFTDFNFYVKRDFGSSNQLNGVRRNVSQKSQRRLLKVCECASAPSLKVYGTLKSVRIPLCYQTAF